MLKLGPPTGLRTWAGVSEILRRFAGVRGLMGMGGEADYRRFELG